MGTSTQYYNLFRPDLSDASTIIPISNNFTIIDNALKTISDNIVGHKESTSAHLDSSIVNTSTVDANKVSDALTVLNAYIANHIASYTAHDSNRITVSSTDPALVGMTNVLQALEYLQTEISTLIIESGTSDAETINARLSSIYGSFTDLKERLDNTDNILSALYEDVNTPTTQTLTFNGLNTIESVTDSVDGIVTEFEVSGATLVNIAVPTTDNWTVTGSVNSILEHIITNTGDGTSSSPTTKKIITGLRASEKIFFRITARVLDSGCQILRTRMFNNDNTDHSIASPTIGRWYDLTGFRTFTSISDLNFYITHVYADSATANGKRMEVNVETFVASFISNTAFATKTADEIANSLTENFEGMKSTQSVVINSANKNLFDGNLLSGLYNDNSFVSLSDSPIGVYKSIKVFLKAGTYSMKFAKAVNSVREIKDGVFNNAPTGTAITQRTFTTTIDAYYGYSFRDTTSSTTVWDLSSPIMLNEGAIVLSYVTPDHTSMSLLATDGALFSWSQVPNGTKNLGQFLNGQLKLIQNVSGEYPLLSSNVVSFFNTYNNVDIVGISLPSNHVLFVDAIQGAIRFEDYIGEIAFDGGAIGGTNDNVSSIGKIATRASNQQFYIYTDKGTYANIAAAQSALAGMKVIYQLAVPITYAEDELASIGVVKTGSLPKSHDGYANYSVEADILGSIAVKYPVNISQSIKNASDTANEAIRLVKANVPVYTITTGFESGWSGTMTLAIALDGSVICGYDLTKSTDITTSSVAIILGNFIPIETQRGLVNMRNSSGTSLATSYANVSIDTSGNLTFAPVTSTTTTDARIVRGTLTWITG